jgi:hypothetical protein
LQNATTDVMAYVGYRAETNTVVIGFRGVMPDSELNRIQAMKLNLVAFAGSAPDAKVHEGFMEMYLSIRKELFKALRTVLAQVFATPSSLPHAPPSHVRPTSHCTPWKLSPKAPLPLSLPWARPPHPLPTQTPQR